jgi:hypothetical protein
MMSLPLGHGKDIKKRADVFPARPHNRVWNFACLVGHKDDRVAPAAGARAHGVPILRCSNCYCPGNTW